MVVVFGVGVIRQMLLKWISNWIKLNTYESVHFIINVHQYCIFKQFDPLSLARMCSTPKKYSLFYNVAKPVIDWAGRQAVFSSIRSKFCMCVLLELCLEGQFSSPALLYKTTKSNKLQLFQFLFAHFFLYFAR